MAWFSSFDGQKVCEVEAKIDNFSNFLVGYDPDTKKYIVLFEFSGALSPHPMKLRKSKKQKKSK
jgi:hypothetical protein